MPYSPQDVQDIIKVKRYLRADERDTSKKKMLGPKACFLLVCLMRLRGETLVYDQWDGIHDRTFGGKADASPAIQISNLAKHINKRFRELALPLKIRCMSKIGYYLDAPRGYDWPV